MLWVGLNGALESRVGIKVFEPKEQGGSLGKENIDSVFWLMLTLQLILLITGNYMSPYRSLPWQTMLLGEGGPSVLAMLSLVVGVTLVLVVFDLFFWSRLAEPLGGRILAQLTYPRLLILLLVTAMGEEMFFRGWLQPTLGIWLSNIIFGILHGLGREKWMAPVVETGLVGLIFGFIFIKTGALIIPVAIHFLFNLTLVVVVKETNLI